MRLPLVILNSLNRQKPLLINFNLAFFVALNTKSENFQFLLSQPNRLISPDTLLQRRSGNSFEMATLLCSLLIGNRYAAMVVSGYASREITNNDQRRVSCPNVPCSSAEALLKVSFFPRFFFMKEKQRKEKCKCVCVSFFVSATC